MLVSLLWFTFSLVALVFAQHWMHSNLQRVLILIFRRTKVAFFIYALLLLPGVVLHEFSHWLVARMLGVRTRNFSLLPRLKPDGSIRFGFVETDRADPVRSALIGVAPLVSGALVLTTLVYRSLGLGSILMGEDVFSLETVRILGERFVETPDLWFWLYLAIVISNTMLPSAADRSAWVPFGLMIVTFSVFIALIGYGPQAAALIATPAEMGMRTLASLFTLTTALDLAFILPLWLLQRMTGWLAQLFR